MSVMTREKWTDERLDDFAVRVDTDIRELRAEMKAGFARIDGRFERVDGRFELLQSEMNRRFDLLQQTMVIGFVALFASIIGAAVVG